MEFEKNKIFGVSLFKKLFRNVSRGEKRAKNCRDKSVTRGIGKSENSPFLRDIINKCSLATKRCSQFQSNP